MDLKVSCKYREEEVRKNKIQIDSKKKSFKKNENERVNLKNEICELEMTVSKIMKEIDDVKLQTAKVHEDTTDILCEQKLLADKNDTLHREDDDIKKAVKGLHKNIEEQENKLRDLKKTEAEAIMSIKNLTTLRG
jgi:chromosome segregation ATPase